MLSRLQLNPFVLISLHAIEIHTLGLAAIVECREVDGERLIALMDADSLSDRDIIIQIIATCEGRLVIYQEFGEAQFAYLMHGRVSSHHRHHASIRTQEYLAFRIADGSIEIELGTEQTIILIETGKGLRIRVENRKSVVRSNPQHSLVVLHNTLDGVVGQSIAGGERLYFRFSHLIILVAV